MRRCLSNGLGIQLGGNSGSGCFLFLYLTPCQRGPLGAIPRSPGIESIPTGWFCGLLESNHQPDGCIGQDRSVPRTTDCRWVCPNGTLPAQRVGARRRHAIRRPNTLILHCTLPLQPFTAAGRKPGRCATDPCLRQGVGGCWVCWCPGVLVCTPNRRGTEVLSPTKHTKPTSRLATLGQNTRARHMPSGLLKR